MRSIRSSLTRMVQTVVGVVMLASLSTLGAPAFARTTPDSLSQIAVADLPREARDCVERIHRGGPFPFERDGVVFGNRERLLPSRPRGYYHEYTVATRSASGRGARRVVCGGPRQSPDICYYTDDHYGSFRRIVE
jgi:ribonuclease T1